jgi:hypothetical protein
VYAWGGYVDIMLMGYGAAAYEAHCVIIICVK